MNPARFAASRSLWIRFTRTGLPSGPIPIRSVIKFRAEPIHMCGRNGNPWCCRRPLARETHMASAASECESNCVVPPGTVLQERLVAEEIAHSAHSISEAVSRGHRRKRHVRENFGAPVREWSPRRFRPLAWDRSLLSAPSIPARCSRTRYAVRGHPVLAPGSDRSPYILGTSVELPQLASLHTDLEGHGGAGFRAPRERICAGPASHRTKPRMTDRCSGVMKTGVQGAALTGDR